MNYDIRKKMVYKGNLFLLSIVGTYAIWSTHSYLGDPKESTAVLAKIYQQSHNRQVNEIIAGMGREEEQYWANQKVDNEAVQIIRNQN
jgi:hypothetical protein